MFGKLFAALKNLFSSLFGSNKTDSIPNQPTAKPTPTPSRPSRPTTSTPPSTGSSSTPTAMDDPQDASELKPDTVIIVAHEMDKVIILPGEEDKIFDEDPLENELPAEEEPAPLPEPEPTPAPPPAPTGRPARYLWCLDNGHGSLTAGKRSPIFDDGETQFLEYEFNRDIVARVSKMLVAEGVQFFNVVPEVEIGNFLAGRVDRANSKSSDLPKIYLSIHANAAPAKSSQHWSADSIKGIETWYFHGSKKGQKIASIFQKHLIDETGFKNRHLKSRPERQFYVLRKTRMSAVLTENGFYNNKGEALELMKDSVRQKIAKAHVAAILEIEENGL